MGVMGKGRQLKLPRNPVRIVATFGNFFDFRFGVKASLVDAGAAFRDFAVPALVIEIFTPERPGTTLNWANGIYDTFVVF